MSSDNKISVETCEIKKNKKNKKKNLTLHRATRGATRRHSYKLMVSAVKILKFIFRIFKFKFFLYKLCPYKYFHHKSLFPD
jgi:hypothetical protein